MPKPEYPAQFHFFFIIMFRNGDAMGRIRPLLGSVRKNKKRVGTEEGKVLSREKAMKHGVVLPR